ncbi:bifunctional metallophosphatase/5'-nucleotidase [Gorillibacterium sp. sgz500922]|uniref:bifunctional metallophosphatase/5'-nucleotidase n=1 Tax=Gorillibacterium sp. sgz500922 TaxID=3446694 RepID=UPI003F67D6A1
MADSTRLVILHTNDIHSHFGQLPQMAGLLNRIRREEEGKAEVLLLDCGDHMDRSSAETEGSRGRANVEMMNRMGVDAALIGNNEGLTLSIPGLMEAYRTAQFPIHCANLRLPADKRDVGWPLPYQIRQVGRLKVALIGATVAYTDFYRLLGWEIEDPEQAVARALEEVRDKAQVVVLLSHLGLSHDRLLAERLPGLDIILGGHTHHLLEKPEREFGTLICGAGKYGTHVGRVTLAYDFEQERITELEGCCLPVEGEEADPAVAAALARIRQESEERLSRPVARLAEPLPAGLDRESRLGDLLADGVRRIAGTGIAVVNAGQLIAGLEAGEVTEGQLQRICPSPIHACSARVTGAELLQALEESLLPEHAGRPIHGYGFRGSVLGTLCVSGLTVFYDEAAPPYRRIVRAEHAGEPIRPDQSYTVGMIAMFAFGLGYKSLTVGRDVRYCLPEFLRDLLAVELKNLADSPEDVWRRRWIPV